MSCALPPLSCPLSISIFIRFPLSYSIIIEHLYPPLSFYFFFSLFVSSFPLPPFLILPSHTINSVNLYESLLSFIFYVIVR
jgi:hypothetical protein